MNYCLIRSSLEIYFAGCNLPHCPGCHNSELHDFSLDSNVNEYRRRIKSKVETGMIEEIHLMGGEPLDQDLKILKDLCQYIKSYGLKIWLWTKYHNYEKRIDFLNLIDYVKYGRYRKELPEYYNKEYDILLASDNQKIDKIIDVYKQWDYKPLSITTL